MTGIAAVLFDMDGTLLDTERIYLEAAETAAASFGVQGVREAFLACVGLPAADCGPVIERALDGRVAYDRFDRAWDEAVRAALAKGIPRKPDALDVLRCLTDRGVPLAVATSTRRATAERHLGEAGLLPFIQAVIGGDDVDQRKPAPETFHRAAAALGVAAAACVAFEDSDIGTRAAVASGARTVQVPDLRPPSAKIRALGHIVAPTLTEGAALAGL